MSRRIALAVAAALLAAACASDPPPSDRYYRLAPAAPAAAGEFRARVMVESVQAHGIYAERSILYRHGEGAPLERFYYHLWAEPPDMLLGDRLANYLRSALGGQAVFDPASRVRTDFVLRTRLRALEQVVDGDKAGALLSLRFSVADANNNAVFALDFEELEPAADASPAAFVQAADRLAARAFGQLAAKLAALAPPDRAG